MSVRVWHRQLAALTVIVTALALLPALRGVSPASENQCRIGIMTFQPAESVALLDPSPIADWIIEDLTDALFDRDFRFKPQFPFGFFE